ncbi:MAG: IS110 family transposase [Candidatus Latescibacterota bacterium]|nr:IS110 family transposase [Candidatus Latescibacterota bacterium]
MDTTTIGVDLAKHVFQLSLAGESGHIVDRRRLSRRHFQQFLAEHGRAEVVMEACATAHHWARSAEAHGHTVRLLHPKYVRPYVRRSKTDTADADALVRASKDPDLHPVPVKSVDQQALQGLHRIRSQWVDTRRQRISLVRALLAEFGVQLPAGATAIVSKLRQAVEVAPTLLADSLNTVIDEIAELEARINQIDRQLKQVARENETIQRLLTIPGVGVITATAMVGSVPDIHAFQRARKFSAWLGLTPREYSSGQTRRLGSISKQGDRYLRMMLVHGARSALLTAHRQARKGDEHLTPLQRWVLDVERRTNHNKATVALANKMARILWCVWTREEDYRA